MRSLRALAPVAAIIAGLGAVLTWFLVQGTAPDAPHTQRADALQAVIFHNAALQRDVLRARAGLLRNYDPLVRSMDGLRAASAELQATREVASGHVQRNIDRRVGALAAAIREQEELLEAFKSDNALLRNSLTYFNYLSSRLAAAGNDRQTGLHDEIGALTAAMLRFVNAPLPDAAGPVDASLDRLAALPMEGALAQDVPALVSHGRFVLVTLPTVDELVARLQAAPADAHARALQSAFSEVRERAAARTDLFLALLYVAALFLLAYVAYLFVRLRRNAEALKERLEIESDLQARLNQSQRLEAIGTLAGGIAHEFNNILGAIRGYGEMALAALLDDAPARRYVEQVMKAGQRAQDVVEQVLAFGRRRERQRRPLAVESVVNEAIDLVRASLPSTVALHAWLSAGGAAVMGDRTELQQVVMNLCTNAAQAMDERGVLTLTLDTVDFGETARPSHGVLPAGRYVRLLVRDTGRGIEPAALERIFEPFFTTKPAGQGTGLGLSTVHGIVGEHGGALDVESRPGDGATFGVYLPRLREAVIVENEAPRPPLPTGQGETILIVDDDRALVLLGEEMLAALGYEPVGFVRSKAALAAFTAEPARFDLVLTDEIMPGMRGTELAEALHELRPDLPVVLMTGYDRPLRPDRLRAAGVREVLKKPLLSRALADCLARQLPAG